jgi:GWxTD domain-containing protein
MDRHASIGAMVCSMLLAATGAWSQVEYHGAAPGDHSETLFLEPLAFAASDSGGCRLDVYVQVGYDNLTFVAEDGRYSAHYELTIDLSDSAGSPVSEKTWNEQIKEISFNESVSSTAYALHQHSFALKPGKYTVTCLVEDLEAKTTKKAVRTCHVRDFATAQVAMSDIMLLSRVTLNGQKRTIAPSVSPNVGNIPESFNIFFQVYNRGSRDSLRFKAFVYSAQEQVVLQTDTVQQVQPGKNDILLRVPHTSLSLGDYALSVRAYRTDMAHGPADPSLAVSNRGIIVRWRGMPHSLKDIDTAIDQLRYVASSPELDEMKNAETIEAKQKLFLDFWKKRDPNPNTPRNEKMEMYYARVDYANKHFAKYREGWKTDMGMVFIMLGPPSSVDRHPFEVDSKPYETWSYFDLNYRYVFVDDTGFGDFRLVTPLWEVYSRRRL